MKNLHLWAGIRVRTKDKGMTLAELANASHVSYDMLKRYGNQYMPSAEALIRIASALGTTAEELLKEENDARN